MEKTLHLGTLIKKYLDSKNYKRSEVAYLLGVPNTAIYGYEKRDSINSTNLLRLCHVLKYNFFLDVANSLPREYGSSQILVSEKDELIARQAKEIEKLKLENDLLKSLITNRSN